MKQDKTSIKVLYYLYMVICLVVLFNVISSELSFDMLFLSNTSLWLFYAGSIFVITHRIYLWVSSRTKSNLIKIIYWTLPTLTYVIWFMTLIYRLASSLDFF